MNSLFDIPPELPEGFFYYPDFISVEEESALIAQIQKHSLNNMIFHGFEAKRKVKSFGYDYHFDNKSLTKGTPIPEEFNWLINNVAKRLNLLSEKFATLLITEYDTGTVINWHRDAPPFEKIAGISLLSDCTFKLRPYDKLKQTRSAIKSFTVERRSLYLMQGIAREEWEHSTAPVKSPRYSITMRTLRSI